MKHLAIRPQFFPAEAVSRTPFTGAGGEHIRGGSASTEKAESLAGPARKLDR
jgi:hypothetical protein